VSEEDQRVVDKKKINNRNQSKKKNPAIKQDLETKAKISKYQVILQELWFNGY